jgi:hypothetical protein
MEDPEVLWRLARAYYDEADKTVLASILLQLPNRQAALTTRMSNPRREVGLTKMTLQPKMGSAEKKALVDKAMATIQKVAPRPAASKPTPNLEP